MKKILITLIAITIALSIILMGCTPQNNEGEEIKIATLAGPTGMGMIKLFENEEDYDITVYTAPDQISAKIINGEIDVATIPSNLAAIIYNNTNGAIEILSVNTLGVLYIIGENSLTINSINDLEGKTLYASGQGATPDFVLSDILTKNDVNTTVQYRSEHSTLASEMISGAKNLAMLPEPFVTMALNGNPDLEIKIAINDEWRDIYGNDAALPMSATIVRKAYRQANEDKIQNLISDYKDSVEFVNDDPESASDAIAQHGVFANTAVTKAAIPRSQISFIEGANMKNMLEGYFEVLYEANPISVGGKKPDVGIYSS